MEFLPRRNLKSWTGGREARGRRQLTPWEQERHLPGAGQGRVNDKPQPFRTVLAGVSDTFNQWVSGCVSK